MAERTIRTFTSEEMDTVYLSAKERLEYANSVGTNENVPLNKEVKELLELVEFLAALNEGIYREYKSKC